MSILEFDEKAQNSLRYLLENFWILRQENPEMYQAVRERENWLKRYVDDKLGFDLIVHQHFIKLEKIPVEAKSWMGLAGFQEPLDYAVFCCALAYSENHTVDEQFLLSDICEDIKDMFPGDIAIDWTNYNHRRSLVRVIKQMEKLVLIKAIEGEVEQFAMDESQEVLYETTIYARYFMRSFPEDIESFTSMETLLESEWERQANHQRRKRVYRKLLMSPVVYRENEEDQDFQYIRQFRNRLRDDLEAHTLFRLEVFKNAAMLVAEERKQELTLFPDKKAISDIALHFAAFVRQSETLQADALGNIYVTPIQLEQIVKTLHRTKGHGWSKQYREGTIKTTTKELMQLLQHWEMAVQNSETGEYMLRPLLGRAVGKYPRKYEESLGEEQIDETK